MASLRKMVLGLFKISRTPSRILREEFVTLTDPYVEEAFKAVMTQGEYDIFENWSRSFYTLEGHLESIEKYNKPLLPEPTDESWSAIKAEAFEYFKGYDRVESLSAKSDLKQVRYHQNTSAGFGYNHGPPPNTTLKGPPQAGNYKRAIKIASAIVDTCYDNHEKNTFSNFLDEIPWDSTPDVAFTRTQLTELPDIKVRNVFGECFHYVLLEGLFAQPLIDYFMTVDSFYYIGIDPIIGVPSLMTQLDRTNNGTQQYAVFDWSGFDSSVQPYEIDLAFDLIESILSFPDIESQLVFKYVRKLFMQRKLQSPDGNVYMRTSGIPSGSYFTHLVDSIINWNRIRYLLKVKNISYGLIKTHGDDCLVELLTHVESLLPLVEYAETLSWKINMEKSQLTQNTTNIEFLGRSSISGSNVRAEDRALRLCLYVEYPVIDPQISIARLKAIDYDTGSQGNHIPKAIRYLRNVYGDDNIELPNIYRPFYNRYFDRPVSI